MLLEEALMTTPIWPLLLSLLVVILIFFADFCEKEDTT